MSVWNCPLRSHSHNLHLLISIRNYTKVKFQTWLSMIPLSTGVTSVQQCVKGESLLWAAGISIPLWLLTPAPVSTLLWRGMIHGQTPGHLFPPSLWRTSSSACPFPMIPHSQPAWDTASMYWGTSREPERNWCCAMILDKVQLSEV